MTDWSTPRGAPYSVKRRESFRDRALDRESPLRRLDWVLMLAVLLLCTLGALLVWGATRPDNIARGLDPNAALKKDMLNVAIGLGLGSVAALVDYRTIR